MNLQEMTKDELVAYAADLQRALAESKTNQARLRGAEEALRESEEKLRLVTENIEDVFWLTTPGIQEMTYVSPAYEKIWGRTRESLYESPKSFMESIHPEDREQLRSVIEKNQEGAWTCEYRIVRPDGTIRWIHDRGYPILDESGNMRLRTGVSTDITDRKIAEERLKESEEKSRRLHETMMDGFVIVDMDGRIQETNHAYQAMLGYSEEELRELTYIDLTPEEWHPFEARIVEEQILVKGYSDVYQKEYRRRDGTIFPVELRTSLIRDEAGQPSSMWAIVRDITERTKAHQEIEEQTRLNQVLLDSFPCVALLLRPHNREIVASNAAAVKAGAVPGTRCFSTWGQRETPCPWCLAPEAWATGQPRHLEVESLGIVWDAHWIPLGPDLYMHYAFDITERKKTEEALRESEEFNRSLVQLAPFGIIYLTVDGVISFTNPTCNRIFGVPEDQPSPLVGLTIFQLPLIAEQPHVVASFQELVQDGRPVGDIEFSYRSPLTNKDFILIASATPRLSDDGSIAGSVVMIADITDRKKAEDALLESMELMRFIVRNDPNAIAVYDRDLHYLAVSKRYLLDYNVKEDDIIGKHHYEVFPEMPQRWKDVHQRCLSGAVESEDDDYFERPDGSVTYNRWECRPWYRSSGDIGGIITYTEVTTDRKLAEKALKESEEKYRRLFENSPVGILSVDAEGRILEVNQMLLEVLGSPSASATKAINMFDLPSLVESGISKAVKSCMATGESVLKQIPYVSTWGKQSYLRIVLTPVKDQDGTIRGCQATVEDTTQQRLLEEQLRQAQKMEAVGTLAGGIAHDFNNLLQVTLGYSELLLQEKTEKDPEYADLQKIYQAGRSGAELVRNLLTFSRKAEPNPLPMSLNNEIRHVEKLLLRTIPKMIDIRLDLAENLERINADPAQIEQIIMNLSVNARDAMGEQGTLTIRTENATLDEDYCRFNVEAKPGEYVLLSVSDTGHGMDKETLQHIFEPFYTTKELGRGTGLGLAMVHGIVKLHGGHVTCYSEVGKGTTFKLYFPAITSMEEPAVEATDIMPAFGTETLLLVDDEDLVRELGQRILTRSGYTVITAINGEDALEVYGRERERIALVILDLIMPTMGGKDCLKTILQVDPQARVLIASGYAADTSTRECVELGAKGFVAKPFRFKELLKQVRKTLDES